MMPPSICCVTLMSYSRHTHPLVFFLSLLLSSSLFSHLCQGWIFTFVIFAWASIYLAGEKGERSENPFKPYQKRFIFVNTCVSIFLFGIFVTMGFTSNLEQLSKLNRIGISLTCTIEILFALFLSLYGLLLVRSLTKDFVSPYAKKLSVVAISLSMAFACSAGVLLFSIAKEEEYQENLITYNAIYFGL